jgi:hypothetical protein
MLKDHVTLYYYSRPGGTYICLRRLYFELCTNPARGMLFEPERKKLGSIRGLHALITEVQRIF